MDKRPYNRRPIEERITSYHDRIKYLKEKLVTKELRAQIIEKEVKRLRDRIAAVSDYLESLDRRGQIAQKANV